MNVQKPFVSNLQQRVQQQMPDQHKPTTELKLLAANNLTMPVLPSYGSSST